MQLRPVILIGLLSMISFTSTADILLIDVIEKEPANNATGLLRPSNGQTMQQVTAQFGAPEQTYATIGEPPITRWKYAEFSVYFEHNLVLNTVVNKPKKATANTPSEETDVAQ